MKLNLIVFSSKQFDYIHATKTLVAEASDLENRHHQRLYDDACDVGFAVRSEVTGDVVVYVLSKTNYSNEDEPEIVSWNYTPSSESIAKYPKCRGTNAVILND